MHTTERIDLQVPFLEKDQAKKLGARWDGRTWYIPPGVALEPFKRWLPSDDVSPSEVNAPQAVYAASLSLSQFLSYVQAAVQYSVPPSQWVSGEISELQQRNGHVYLTLAEHDENGQLLARSRATIWRSLAGTLLQKFTKATGGALRPDMKVLFRVCAEFHVLHGFNLIVEDIDPAYTLGDMAAKLKAIRDQLVQLGLLDNNKKLTPPADFTRVAVVAPPQAAGLGDFKREADVLAKHRLCRFDYYHAQFQGATAAEQLTSAIAQAITAHQNLAYDAIVIIRGGGAVTDLAWLNHFDIAAAVCQCPIPVFSGIGHERDNTIVDEVACRCFDTPSKVIQYIFHTIKDRAFAAAYDGESIRKSMHVIVSGAHTRTKLNFHALQQLAGAQWHAGAVVVARHRHATHTSALMRLDRTRQHLVHNHGRCQTHTQSIYLHLGRRCAELWRHVKQESRRPWADAATAMQQWRSEQQQLQENLFRHQKDRLLQCRYQISVFLEQFLPIIAKNVLDKRKSVANFAVPLLRQAEWQAQHAMKQVLGMEPRQTLARGFVIVRDMQNNPLTRASMVTKGQFLQLDFFDASVIVKESHDEQDN